MSETTPQNIEGLAERQAKVLTFAKKKFDKAVERVDSQISNLNKHGSNTYKNHPKPTWSEPVGDGGMDIQDRKVEMGSWEEEGREHDYYTSPDAEEDLEHLEKEVAYWHEAMVRIESGDEDVITKYLEEFQKSQQG